MGSVVITCPTTGKEVPTGVAVPAELFKTASFTEMSFSCPQCGQMHHWNKGDARVK